MTEKPKKPRGFAAMDPELRRKIARKGGRNVPAEKRSFSQNRELARQAGRNGGRNVDPENRTFSKRVSLAIEAGRKGGRASRRTKSVDVIEKSAERFSDALGRLAKR